MVARVAWAVVILITVLRSGCGLHRSIAFANFRLAGTHWLQAEYLYGDRRGFIYSPLAAAFFAPFAMIPPSLGIVIWQLINAAALLAGLAALLRLFPQNVRRHSAISHLLMIPWAIGNLDIGHSNPLLAGLIMLSVAAADSGRWTTSAICIGLATYLKIYPVAVAMLLLVIAPRQFGWRFLIVFLAMAVAPFFLQNWHYVSDQYRAWFATRGGDDRLNYPLKYAPLDLWFLLHWIGHLPVPPLFYTLLQAGGGGAVALFCWWSKWKKQWSPARVFIALFSLVSIWMVLLGPATESYTYILLAPVLITALVHLFSEKAFPLKICVLLVFIMELAAVARNIFLSHFNPPWIFALQPLGALLLVGPCLAWLGEDAFWNREAGPEHPRG